MRGEEDNDSGGPLRSNPVLLMRGALPWPDSESAGSRHHRGGGGGGGGPGSAASGSYRSAQATQGASISGSASNNSEPILAPLRHEYVSGRLRYSLSPMRYVTRLDEARHHAAVALEPSSAAIVDAAAPDGRGHGPESGSGSGSGPVQSVSPAPPSGEQQEEGEEEEGKKNKRRFRHASWAPGPSPSSPRQGRHRHASWALARWSRQRDESLDSEPSSSAKRERESDWIRPMDWGRRDSVDSTASHS